MKDVIEGLRKTKGCVVAALEAARWNEFDLFKSILSEENLDIDCENDDGRTPLMFACSGGNVDIAKYLLVHGADPNKQDLKGNTALHWCFKGVHKKKIYMELASLVTGSGGVTTILNEKSLSPIDIAKKREIPELMLLLED